jgi:4-hydroxy-tetrahydrodipicolinate synthase
MTEHASLTRGSIPPMITPMTPDASGIDPQGIAALVEWHIDQGSTGLFVVCTTGEMFHLTAAEMVEAVKAAVEAANGRIPIIAGLPFPDLDSKIEVGRRYAEVGASGIVVVQPHEDPLDEQVWYEHFMRFADAVAAPVLIYENPKWPTCLTPHLVARLSASGRYVGMKDCTGDVERLVAMADAGKGGFGVMQAVQEQLLSSFICGATGSCCTASNTHPHLYRRIHDLVQDNRIDEAYALQEKIRRWLLLYKQANSAKHVLNAIGLPINVASRRDGTVTGERLAHARTLAELVKAEI